MVYRAVIDQAAVGRAPLPVPSATHAKPVREAGGRLDWEGVEYSISVLYGVRY